MAKMLLKAVLAATAVTGSGCARWQSSQPANYVTLEADGQHDTEQAQKDYNSARKYLDKHLRGETCDLSRVEAKLQKALAADVRFGPAHHTLGVIYFWQQKLYLAAWEFEYASRLMADRFEPLNNLGLVYEAADKYEQAKTYYCLAREKERNQPDVIANLARVSYRSGTKVDDMRPLLEDVLATNPHPEWRRWAAELLGINPSSPLTVSPETIDSLFAKPPDALPSEEDLPLIAPPAPAEAPDPIPAEPLPLPPVERLTPDIEFNSSR